MTDTATPDGARLIEYWLKARERVDSAERELNSAKCDQANCQSALAKWMLPSDYKVGEKIGIWQGDTLFQVEKTTLSSDALVTIRTRGKDMHRLMNR
jgi:hypothetical protein